MMKLKQSLLIFSQNQKWSLLKQKKSKSNNKMKLHDKNTVLKINRHQTIITLLIILNLVRVEHLFGNLLKILYQFNQDELIELRNEFLQITVLIEFLLKLISIVLLTQPIFRLLINSQTPDQWLMNGFKMTINHLRKKSWRGLYKGTQRMRTKFRQLFTIWSKKLMIR